MVRAASPSNPFLGAQKVRLLRIFLLATTFLYTYGVVFTIFPLHPGLTYANPAGGIIAIGLGISALAYTVIRPGRTAYPTAVAIVATPVVMAFHIAMIAEYVCLIGPMFLAMFLRAFHSAWRAWTLIALLIAACVGAIAVAPAPHVGLISYLIIIVAIAGAAESFGLLMRAMFAAACTDPLTGLLNRAGWEIATHELLGRHRAAEVSVTVVAIDLVGLKRINDTYGHQAGDGRIVSYASRWTQSVPRRAVLARLGGDEFGICLVGESAGAVDDLLASVRRDTPMVSLGVAVETSRTPDIAALLARADAALYQSRGRPLRGQPGDVA